MKKLYMIFVAIALTIAAEAQTLNVRVGNVTYRFPAAQCGEMNYANGTTLTIMDKEFSLNEVTNITFDPTEVVDNTIAVTYNGSTASVVVAGNIAQYVTPTVSGDHVGITQHDDLAEEITYTLSGTSTDGEFYMSGSYMPPSN